MPWFNITLLSCNWRNLHFIPDISQCSKRFKVIQHIFLCRFQSKLQNLIYDVNVTQYKIYIYSRGAYRYLRLLIMVYFYQKQNLTVPSVFQRTANKYPNRVCLHFEDESWTFKQVRVWSYSGEGSEYISCGGFGVYILVRVRSIYLREDSKYRSWGGFWVYIRGRVQSIYPGEVSEYISLRGFGVYILVRVLSLYPEEGSEFISSGMFGVYILGRVWSIYPEEGSEFISSGMFGVYILGRVLSLYPGEVSEFISSGMFGVYILGRVLSVYNGIRLLMKELSYKQGNNKIIKHRWDD